MNSVANTATKKRLSQRSQQSPVDKAIDQFNFAVENSPTREALFDSLSKSLVQDLGAKIVLSLSSDGDEIAVQQSCFEFVPDNIKSWGTNIGTKSLLEQRLTFEVSTDSKGDTFCLIANPIAETAKQSTSAWVALFPSGSENWNAEKTAIKLLTQSVVQWEQKQQTTRTMRIAEDIAAIKECDAKIGRTTSVDACCQQIADSVCEYLSILEAPRSLDDLTGKTNGEQTNRICVYVGQIEKDGRPELRAISNLNTLPDDSALIDAIESAMAESLCRSDETNWPPADDGNCHALLCHRQAAVLLGKPNIKTISIQDPTSDAKLVVLVSLSSALSLRASRFVTCCAESIESTFSLICRTQKTRIQKALASVTDAFANKRTKTILKCIAAVILVGFIPLPYKVVSECELQPTVKRFVCAPFQSQLQNCLVEPGEIVRKNQLIAELSEKELSLELAEAEAQLHSASKKRDGFLVEHNSGDAKVAQFEAERLQAKNDLLKYRTDNRLLRSPIDGLVLNGDLKKVEGMPLERGQSLFEIAPLDELTMELFIPESDVRFVKPGMNVRIGIDAFPFEVWRGTIDKLHPAAELHNDENVFVATVSIQNDSGKLRPGMQGSAKTTSVWRPFWFNVLHKPVANCARFLGW